jgi:uncharacterized membrane protein
LLACVELDTWQKLAALHGNNLTRRPVPSRTLWVLAWTAILVAGLGLRACELGRSVYWYDEAISSVMISGYQWDEIRGQLAGREFHPAEVLRFQRPTPGRGLHSTLQNLAVFDPQHAPLYFVAARAWTGMVGASPAAIRWLSVVAGLLAIPLFFVLAAELFQSRRAGWIAAGLAVLSPFHVIYSREARPYAWLTVAVLASSLLLLKASRRGLLSLWVAYGLCIAAGMYIHLGFATVVAAHGVWVVVNAWSKTGTAKLRARGMVPYVVATALGLILFIPWLRVILANTATASRHLDWTKDPVGMVRLAAMWAHNYSALFLDSGVSIKHVEHLTASWILAYALRVGLLVVAGFALVRMVRTAGRLPAIFVLGLLTIPFVTFAVPDILFGGLRSGGGSRYLLASYIGLGLVIAHFLDRLLASRRSATGISLALIFGLCGLYSCIRLVRAEVWWTKAIDYYTPRVIRTINQAEAPLVYTRINGHLMTLAHGLAPKVRLRSMDDADSLDLTAARTADVFFYVTSAQQLDQARQRFGDAFQPADAKGGLWRIVQR